MLTLYYIPHRQRIRQIRGAENEWPEASMLVVKKRHPVRGAHQCDIPGLFVHGRIVGHLLLEAAGLGHMRLQIKSNSQIVLYVRIEILG